jgi:DNA-binding MarR family transcriptional regulator
MPVPGPAVQAYVALLRAADALRDDYAEALAPVELTPTQYEVLRLLRDAGPQGLPCGDLGRRLLAREPDVTRLLDRLDRRGLVRRERDEDDRRVVRARLTAEGQRVVGSLDRHLADLHERQFAVLGEARLKQLVAMLEAVRTLR